LTALDKKYKMTSATLIRVSSCRQMAKRKKSAYFQVQNILGTVETLLPIVNDVERVKLDVAM